MRVFTSDIRKGLRMVERRDLRSCSMKLEGLIRPDCKE